MPMSDELTDAIFNACAAVAMIGFTMVISVMALLFIAMIWKLMLADDKRD